MSTATATPQEMLARAEALRPALIERQEETERLARYPEATHRDFLDAGFYRLLTPRRYGGYEMAFADYLKVIDLIAERLAGDTLLEAVALASYPEKIRGFGHVKAETVLKVVPEIAARREAFLAGGGRVAEAAE